MTETRKGILAMVAACSIWGLSPLYYKLLEMVPPGEVLSHRTLWSLLFFGIVLAFQGRLGQLPRLLLGGQILSVALAAVMISANWFVFILSIQIDHAVQASLGYYIFPLVAVLFGVVAFGERLSLGQGVAVALAVLAVIVLTYGLGVAPWISLFLATTFGLYGLMKKRIDAGPVVSVTAEVLLLAPLAAIWLTGIYAGLWTEGRPGGFFGHSLWISVLLAFSGLITGGPLILFSYAARRVNLGTVGVLQYINPTLQFLCATLVFQEAFTRWHLIAFSLIWTAVVIYCVVALRQDRASRRAATMLAASGTTPI